MRGRRRKLGEVDLGDRLRINDDEIDLAAIDGWVDEENEETGNTEMLSFRMDETSMNQLKAAAETLGVGHTILARELLLDGLRRLTIMAENEKD